MAAPNLHWQPELHLVQAVKASAAALEQVLASTECDGRIPAGPSTSTLEVKSSLRIVKGACSALQGACTVACRTVSERVKIIQRGTATGSCSDSFAHSPAQNSGNGLKALETGSGGDPAILDSSPSDAPKPPAALAPAVNDGSGPPEEVESVFVGESLGKSRGRRHRRSKKQATETAEEGGIEYEKSFVDVGTQTEATEVIESNKSERGSGEMDVRRRSERLREKDQNDGFLTDRITGSEDKSKCVSIMSDAWKAYQFGHGVSLVQYLKIAGLICEGYLKEGPEFSHRDRKGWKDWEKFVEEAERKKLYA